MSNIGNLGLQGVTLQPKFMFGINGALHNNLFVIEDKKLLYVAGHNVIIYNPEEQSQFFIPASEGTEGINHIALSPAKKWLAICERGPQRAQVTTYNLQTRKRGKVIPEEGQEVDYKCQEFIGAAFCPKEEKKNLLTLCGEPDFKVILWCHEKFQMLAQMPLGIVDPPPGASFQISYVNASTTLNCAVTGPDCFRFLSVNANGSDGFQTV
jgi:hypothetical protein